MDVPLRHRISRLLGVILVLLVTFVTVGGQAFADGEVGGIGGGTGGGGSSGGGGGGGSSGGGGGSSGGGGGTSAWRYFSDSYWLSGITNWCVPDENGQQSIGYRVSYRYPSSITLTEAENHVAGAVYRGDISPVENIGTRCLYPPSYVDARVTCVLEVQVAIDLIMPRTASIASRTQGTAYAGDPTLGNCLNSSLTVPLYQSISEFGRYTFDSSATQQACVIRTYTSADPRTGITPGTALRDCGSPYVRAGTPGTWELTCSGFRQGFSAGIPDWTMNDCLAGGSVYEGQAQCSFSGTNTLDGIAQTTPAQLMRDGVKRPVSFATPNLTGSGITVTGSQTRVLRDGSSTPWNSLGKGSAISPHNAEFRVFRGSQGMLTTPTETNWQAGIVGDGWSVAGYWASDSAHPTLLSAEYLFDLTVAVQSVAVTGVEPIAGTITTETTTIQVPTTASCVSPSLSIEYLRAVNG